MDAFVYEIDEDRTIRLFQIVYPEAGIHEDSFLERINELISFFESGDIAKEEDQYLTNDDPGYYKNILEDGSCDLDSFLSLKLPERPYYLKPVILLVHSIHNMFYVMRLTVVSI